MRKRNYTVAARNLTLHAINAVIAAVRALPATLETLSQARPSRRPLSDRQAAPCDTATTRLALGRLLGLRGRAAPAPSPDRPRLALVTPLPPERTGIADYSADLVPAMTRHYDIVLVSAAARGEERLGDTPVRSYDWFAGQAHTFDRILYHFGNSPFHTGMIDLLERFPGIVMLHDLSLADLAAHLGQTVHWRRWWREELYNSHGYAPLRHLAAWRPLGELVRRFPTSAFVFQQAEGVLVHSAHARDLAQENYGELAAAKTAVVPFSRRLTQTIDRSAARAALGLGPDDFLVCSFGFVAPSKLSHLLVEAWIASKLATAANCRLLLVGSADKAYEARLMEAAARAGAANVAITGFAPAETYARHLAAADLAVQLRTDSRGESSAGVFDALAQGLPTIVNAHGSFAELPADTVSMVSDGCSAGELAERMEQLWTDGRAREELSATARRFVAERHSLAAAAEAYRDAIERFAAVGGRNSVPALLTAAQDADLLAVARELTADAPRIGLPCIFVDVSALAVEDLGTGIQRVVRAQLLELMETPPPGYRIEPVRLIECEGRPQFVYARRYAARLLHLGFEPANEPLLELAPGDVFYSADLAAAAAIRAHEHGLFQAMKARGVRLAFLVHDLLPVSLPDCFPPGSDEGHARWLRTVGEVADLLLAPSRAVRDDLERWIGEACPERRGQIAYGALHHGFDLAASGSAVAKPRRPLPELERIRSRKSVLMVGTVEPRKGYDQALDAFEILWAEGVDLNLVIVGREGWRHLPAEQRRSIPETVRRLRASPERGRRLFWLDDLDDHRLVELFASCSGLLMASWGEGFGLPIVEAAAAGLPVIARDIPVFREIAGEGAFYFEAKDGAGLAQALRRWSDLHDAGEQPSPGGIGRKSWAENAGELKRLLVPPRAKAAAS